MTLILGGDDITFLNSYTIMPNMNSINIGDEVNRRNAAKPSGIPACSAIALSPSMLILPLK
ncbi:hypothetical protein TUM16664_38830 [Enterobacter cloacae]|nr:hypothetical protein TUM16664_38830 [Enterobacter cloacae]